MPEALGLPLPPASFLILASTQPLVYSQPLAVSGLWTREVAAPGAPCQAGTHGNQGEAHNCNSVALTGQSHRAFNQPVLFCLFLLRGGVLSWTCRTSGKGSIQDRPGCRHRVTTYPQPCVVLWRLTSGRMEALATSASLGQKTVRHAHYQIPQGPKDSFRWVSQPCVIQNYFRSLNR